MVDDNSNKVNLISYKFKFKMNQDNSYDPPSFRNPMRENSNKKPLLNPKLKDPKSPDQEVDETEQEAIELIKNQQFQIKALKEELKHKDDGIESLKIQNK